MQWTLDELVDRATRALADVRVANGRVTEVPDARLVRWYATRGLVDRPAPGPGRAARYGVRHLLQLVAVKRLQAQGLPLVEIQRRLTGATDPVLHRLAAVDPADPVLVADLSWPDGLAVVGHTAHRGDSVVADDTVERVIRLGPVSLRLPLVGECTAEDLYAIAAAAGPLLEVLTERGLLRAEGESHAR
jgi:hypothetical protein